MGVDREREAVKTNFRDEQFVDIIVVAVAAAVSDHAVPSGVVVVVVVVVVAVVVSLLEIHCPECWRQTVYACAELGAVTKVPIETPSVI